MLFNDRVKIKHDTDTKIYNNNTAIKHQIVHKPKRYNTKLAQGANSADNLTNQKTLFLLTAY